MIQWLRWERDGILIVHSISEVYRLEKEFPDLKGRIYPPHSVSDGRLRGRRNLIVGIDNLDLILPALFGAEVGPVTVTEEVDEDLLR
jgi:hypothetical protein